MNGVSVALTFEGIRAFGGGCCTILSACGLLLYVIGLVARRVVKHVVLWFGLAE
jgi:hypothetical protein